MDHNEAGLVYVGMQDAQYVLLTLNEESDRASALGNLPVLKFADGGRELLLISSEGQVKSDKIADHFDWVLDRYVALFQSVVALECPQAELNAIYRLVSVDRNGGGPTITPSIMSRLIMLGVKCRLIIE